MEGSLLRSPIPGHANGQADRTAEAGPRRRRTPLNESLTILLRTETIPAKGGDIG